MTYWRRPFLRWLLGRTRLGFAMREAGKSGLVASLWPTRHLVLALGRRLVAAGHLEQAAQAFHLSKADLWTFLQGYWDGRGEGWLAAAHTPPAAFDGQVWHGLGVSAGQVTAVVRAIRHPDESARLGHGEILVAPSTAPGWTLPAVVNIPGILNQITDGERLTVDGDAATVRHA